MYRIPYVIVRMEVVASKSVIRSIAGNVHSKSRPKSDYNGHMSICGLQWRFGGWINRYQVPQAS